MDLPMFIISKQIRNKTDVGINLDSYKINKVKSKVSMKFIFMQY